MDVFKSPTGSVHVELPRLFGYLPFVSVTRQKPDAKITEVSAGIGRFAVSVGRYAEGGGVYLSWM
jgi:hypothetical protein